MACQSLNISKDDNIITSPITFVASANCGEFVGAKHFADIDHRNFCIDPVNLEKILRKKNQVGCSSSYDRTFSRYAKNLLFKKKI